MRKKGNKKSLALLLALAVVVGGVAGISAYFTATDTVKNTFNVQKVDVELTEPNYTDEQKVVPNQTIKKDPTVTNIGTADEFVFLSVKVPYKKIVTANADGTKNEEADIELFAWNYDPSTTEAELKEGDAAANLKKGLGNGAVNAGWTLVKTNVSEPDGEGKGTVEYIYAWGTASEMTALSKDASTSALFNTVTMCNAIEGQGLEGTKAEIQVNVYAIQASDLSTSGNGTKVPSEVLNIYLNQNSK